jgi:uncharacterized protein (TIGR03083 family)
VFNRTTTDSTTRTLLHLAAVLEAQPAASWDHPSLCERWRVREVVAHLTTPTRWAPPAFMAEVQADGGDLGRTVDRLAEQDAALAPTDLVAGLRDERLHHWQPPGGGEEGALIHAVVHALDVLLPLDLDDGFPAEPLLEVLDLLTRGGAASHFGVGVDDLALAADDLEWRFGSGEPLRADAAHLAVLLCGRRTAQGSLRP